MELNINIQKFIKKNIKKKKKQKKKKKILKKKKIVEIKT